jgi:hypothetical protein
MVPHLADIEPFPLSWRWAGCTEEQGPSNVRSPWAEAAAQIVVVPSGTG